MKTVAWGDPMRATSSVCLGVMLLAAGCSPPPPQTAEVKLSVGMPTGNSSDPGQLTDDEISPPKLGKLDAYSAAFRSDGKGLVSTVADGQKAELVPTPNAVPDRTGKRAPTPEVVPVPPGIPSAEMAANAPVDYRKWATPDVALVVTGQQHGYIEPCGCTGLEKQKGGMARRFTFMKELRDRGWELVPIDGGNQVRRFGRQAEIKLQQTAKALRAMDYQAVGFGPDDLRLGVGELLAVAASEDSDESMYTSANVVLIDPELMPQYRLIEHSDMKIGITTVLDPESLETEPSDEIIVNPMIESTQAALEAMQKEKPTFKVLAFFGDEEAAKKLAVDVPGFDLMVVAGGYGEPTYQAVSIKDTDTKMIITGNKGMYAGLVGLYADEPMKYARVPLTHEFKDAPEMRKVMADYQNQLRDVGLAGLGLKPIPHPSGREFVGSAKCGECHKTAFDIWEGSPHFEATDHIVEPSEDRGDVARHFDPECLSCHVTGWNAQNYYPYQTGFLSLEKGAHLTGNGCENCHGPGQKHANAELPDSGVDESVLKELREQMKLSYEDAHEKCMECHDLDNSPDFHVDDAFEDVYWPEVEHYGVD